MLRYRALLLSLFLAGGPSLAAENLTAPATTMTAHHVSGRFEVKLPTLAPDNAGAPASFGRRALDKRYHGALDASGKGEMLSAGTATAGSAGYVAIEQVQGTLDGRSGSFALLHRGLMTRGTPELSVVVVPDSGTDALAGLAGSMNIRIENGEHFYDFDYTLP